MIMAQWFVQNILCMQLNTTFDGKIKKCEEANSQLLGLKKHFHVHDYLKNMKAIVQIINMSERASIWWEYLKSVKENSKRKITWKQFNKYFGSKFLREGYYEGKIKEFHDLKLGKLAIYF